mmetsp:Transcript_49156/g.153948  ORF Transcript_49156/g.153948 Transcript_49156/m.153948 type:complete len:258 (+) Transcript_49156:686-1459(+)
MGEERRRVLHRRRARRLRRWRPLLREGGSVRRRPRRPLLGWERRCVASRAGRCLLRRHGLVALHAVHLCSWVGHCEVRGRRALLHRRGPEGLHSEGGALATVDRAVRHHRHSALRVHVGVASLRGEHVVHCSLIVPRNLRMQTPLMQVVSLLATPCAAFSRPSLAGTTTTLMHGVGVLLHPLPGLLLRGEGVASFGSLSLWPPATVADPAHRLLGHRTRHAASQVLHRRHAREAALQWPYHSVLSVKHRPGTVALRA